MAKPLFTISSMNSKRGGGRSMKATATAAAATTTCIPMRFKSSRNVATPMSLLERFRKVVLRLIMFSAISKGSPSPARSRREASPAARPYRHLDSYRSEAVEDCIEFFKRSAGSSDVAKSSNVSEEPVDAASGVLPSSPVAGLQKQTKDCVLF